MRRPQLLVGSLLLALLPAVGPVAAASEGGAAHPEIVGGTTAPPGAHPFIAALVWSSVPDARDGLRCGATMLDDNWVLSAAHCTVGFGPGAFDVVVGRDSLSSGDGERIGVAEIHQHPGFVAATYENDIVLLRLESSAGAGEPIRWVIEAQADVFAAGTTATAVGWGWTFDDPPGTGYHQIQDDLRQVDVPIRPASECTEAYGGWFHEALMVCAGYPEGGRDACNGDSGGPLYVTTSNGIAQVGITSWGSGCAEPEAYGVYTRVAHYAGWIGEITGIEACDGVHPTILGGDGTDVLTGTRFTDVIHGGGGDDTLLGKGGDDILCGGPGDDVLEGGYGADIIGGGMGADRLVGHAGPDLLDGGSGPDEILGGSGDDTLLGQGDGDLLAGGTGDDLVRGGPGDDSLFGFAGGDRMNGGAGDDLVRGGREDDRLAGGSGGDDVQGGAGDDRVDGGPDDDTLTGGSGIDVCVAGETIRFGCESVV